MTRGTDEYLEERVRASLDARAQTWRPRRSSGTVSTTGSAAAAGSPYPSDEFEGEIVALAVRPGSTPDQLTVAFTVTVEGSFEVRWTRWSGDAPEVGAIEPAGFAVASDAPPEPVWSPDGSHLAFAVDGRLRTVDWTPAGPGSDDADFGAPELSEGVLRQVEPGTTPATYVLSVGAGTDGASLRLTRHLDDGAATELPVPDGLSADPGRSSSARGATASCWSRTDRCGSSPPTTSANWPRPGPRRSSRHPAGSRPARPCQGPTGGGDVRADPG